MHSEFDPLLSEKFVEVARQRRFLSDEQAKTLLAQASEQSLMSSTLAVESGMMEPLESEVVEAFMAPKDLAPGYELLDVLGYGALGVVYRARQPRLQRDVAIKAIMQSRLAQQNVIARFQQEAAAIGRLQHPNIVSAYDSGSYRNRLFLVMELVEGCDLRERLDRGPLDLPTALSVVRQTALGLAYALAQQIIHRDIKPGNLILTDAPPGFDLPPGVPLVKIADFGLARLNPPADLDQANTRLTLTGAALGTPMYCAPEQLTGDDVDHRADIYALGATLFRTISGRAPFEDEKVSKIIAAKVTGQAPRLELLPRDLDSAARQLLLDMIAHDPDQRIPDYETLIGRVDRLQPQLGAHRAAESWSTTVPPVSANATAAKRWTVGGVSLLALAAVSLIVLALALPNWWSKPAVPTMARSGWETHLFDGKTITKWTDRNGLWHGGTDSEGGAILVGKGSAVRQLPDPPAQPGVESSIGVRINIDLQKAAAAEVHFGFSAVESDDSRRLVARFSQDEIVLGSRLGIKGELQPLGPPMEPPKNTFPDDAPRYHEIRIELHGLHWFVYFDGDLIGDTAADADADNRTIQLVAPEGAVHFEGLSVFGLTAKAGPE